MCVNFLLFYAHSGITTISIDIYYTLVQAYNIYAISDLRIEGRGLLANLRDKDNLSTVDKTSAPNVSVDWRFHCINFDLKALSTKNLSSVCDGLQ